MKSFSLYILLLPFLMCSCSQPTQSNKKHKGKRIISASKQYTELMYALGVDSLLVGVDLSSTYPQAAQKLPNIGYHMHLSLEGMASLEPDLILHKGGHFSIGPEHVVNQLKKLKIPLYSFENKAKDIPSTYDLIKEMGVYFNTENKADAIIQQLKKDMEIVEHLNDTIKNRPKVLAIHFGQAMNIYLALDKNSVGGQMIEWAGGKYCLDKGKGMNRITSPEMIAKSNPDIIFLTGFGYDRLGSLEKIKELPGVALTNAAKHNRIYRVEAHDLIYYGPRTGKNVIKLHKIMFP